MNKTLLIIIIFINTIGLYSQNSASSINKGGPPGPSTTSTVVMSPRNIIQTRNEKHSKVLNYISCDGPMYVAGKLVTHKVPAQGKVSTYFTGVIVYNLNNKLYIETGTLDDPNNRIKSEVKPANIVKTKYSTVLTAENGESISFSGIIKGKRPDSNTLDGLSVYDLYTEMKSSGLFNSGSSKSICIRRTSKKTSDRGGVVTNHFLTSSERMMYVGYKTTTYPSVVEGIILSKEPTNFYTRYVSSYNGVPNGGGQTPTVPYIDRQPYHIIDTEAPTFSFPSDVGTYARKDSDRNKWHSKKSLTVTANNITDNGGVGIKDYYWKYNSKTTIKGNRITIGEGRNSIEFAVIDHLGHSRIRPTGKSDYYYVFQLDATPPSINRPRFKDFSFVNGNLNAEFDWSVSVDRPANVDNSGLQGYYSKLRKGTSATVPTHSSGSKVSNNLSVIKKKDVVTEGEDNLFSLYTKDYANNKSHIESYLLKVPNILQIDSIESSAQASANGISFIPEYSMKLKFTLTKDQFDYNNQTEYDGQPVTKYYLSRKINNNIVELGEIILTEESDETFTYTDTFKDTSENRSLKHTYPEYVVTTKRYIAEETFIKTVNGKNVVTKNTITPKTVPVGSHSWNSTQVANIIPSTNTEVIYGSTSSVKPQIKLSENYSDIGFDVEKDYVKYTLKYKKPSDDGFSFDYIVLSRIASTQPIEKNNPNNPDSFMFKESGEYNFRLISSDYLTENSSNPLSSKVIKEFPVIFDQIAPQVDFNVIGKHRDAPEGGVLNGSPTNNENVTLALTVTEDFSKLGKIDIIKDGDTGNKITYTLDNLVSKKWVTVNEKEYSIEIPDFKIDTDKSQTKIGIEVWDTSGNSTLKSITVTLDKEKPVVSNYSAVTYSVDNDDKYIKYSWITNETGVISYVNGSALTLGVTEYIFRATNYNETEEITVDVIDRAGNKTSKTVKGCSRAVLGTFKGTAPGHDYNPENNEVSSWIELEVEYNSSTATGAAIDLYNSSDIKSARLLITIDGSYSVNVKNSSEVLSYDITSTTNLGVITKKVKVYGLPRHNPIKYKLVAINNIGNEEISEISNTEITNYQPVFSNNAVVYPTNNTYAKLNDTISWERAIDKNGDPIKYNLKVWDINNSNNPVIDVDTYLLSNNLTGLDNSKVYKWSVTATDNFETYNSLSKLGDYSFKIDNSNPKIVSHNLPKEYYFTNAKTVTFKVSDIETSTTNNSGIGSVKTVINGTENITILGDNSNQETLEIIRDVPEGIVNISLNVFDKVNFEAKNTYKVLVDRTIPTVSRNIKLNTDNNNFYTPENTVPVEFKVKDNFSGLSHFEYCFTDNLEDSVLEDDWIEVKLKNFVPEIGDNKEYTITKKLNFPYANGNNKFLHLRVYDYAGNFKLVRTQKSILLDNTEPVFKSKNNIFNVANNKNYLGNIDKLKELNVLFEDPESGLFGTKYILIDGDTQRTIKDFTDTSITPGTLINGKSYSLKYIGKNKSGKFTVKSGSSFIFDSTPPTDLKLDINMDRGSYIKGESITFNLSVNEADSPIVVSELKIGTDSDPIFITNNITGNTSGIMKLSSGWILGEDNIQRNTYQFNLPQDLENGTYNVRLTCINGANRSISVVDELVIDNDVEVLLVETPSSYTPFDNKLKASWVFNNPSPDIEISNVSYRVKDVSDPVVLDDLSNNELLITLPNGTLELGVGYEVEVTLSLSNEEVITAYSAPIYLDNTPPELNEDELEIWPEYSESEKLYAKWKVSDGISGIENINLKVEKQLNKKWELATEKEWINVNGFKNEEIYYFNNLDIKTGDRVRITREFVNGAGIPLNDVSEVIIIDDTPPGMPVVYNKTPFINPEYIVNGLENERPEAHWKFSEGDLESGVTYHWAFVNDIINVETNETIVWTQGTSDKKAIINNGFNFHSGLHGETWYFVVKAVNGLGKESFGRCTGITFDTTAPVIADVKLLEEKEGNLTEAYFITSTSDLNLYINASDDIVGNNLYYSADYGVRDERGTYSVLENITTGINKNVLPINNISLSSGDIITLRGIVINDAKISETGFSSTVKVDMNPAKLDNIAGYVNNRKLNYSWDVIAGDSPIAYYEYKLVNNGVVIDDWVKVYSRVKSFLTDPNGRYKDGNYTFKVRAVSDSGQVSDISESNPLYIDNTPPKITTLSISEYIFEILEANITTTDASGIEEYKYRLGTFNKPELLSEGWVTVRANSNSLNLKVDLSNKIITDGERLYFSIIVKDNAGNWSPLTSSSAISVDKTPALISNVTIPRYSRFDNKIEGITLKAEDLQSGLDKITIAIYNNGTKSKIYSKDITVSGLSHSETEYVLEIGESLLNNDTDYIVRVKATNGTGEECLEVESTKIVTVDTEVPTLVFDEQENEIVVNQSASDNKYNIYYNLSEKCDVTFTLERFDGTSLPQTVDDHIKGDHFYGYHHNYNTEEEAYGNYVLKAVIVDRAGNISESKQRIRYNSPPDVTVFNMITNPGRPLELRPYNAKDSDTPLTYEWTIYGNGATAETIVKTGDDNDLSDLTCEFIHSVFKSPRSAYLISLKVTDAFNKSTEVSFEGNSNSLTANPLMVIVRNTWEGPLYVDEYWSEFGDETSHIIGGDIIVGDETTNKDALLTILENTTIEVSGNLEVGYDHEIIVNSKITTENSENTIEPNINFMMNPYIADVWKGIRINSTGEALLNFTEIRDARRAVSAIGIESSVTLNNCVINNNIIGIHTFNSNPTINNTSITNNSAYGIKEDGTSEPVLTNTTINNNTIDYYDSVNAFISGENE